MQEKLLDILYKNEGKYVLSQEITSNLGISPETLKTKIGELEKEGYVFDFSTKLGYRLKRSSPLLLPYEIKKGLETRYIGQKIHYFQEVDSTNDVAKKLADEGAEEGTMVIAETQTRGKGRRGKPWISPQGGIWLSIILNPHMAPADAPKLTLMAGVAVAKTLKKEFEVDVGIKWPNDILIGKKKVCGILAETNTKFNTVDYVVVGIGIDANVDTIRFPSEISLGATSLKQELGKDIGRVELVQSLLNTFEETYEQFKSGTFPDILNEWRRMSKTIGTYVEVKKRLGRIVRGEAVGITNNGILILEQDDKSLRKVISGQCIHLEK